MLQLRLQGTFPWFGGGAGQAKQSDPLHHHIFLPRSLLPQFTLLQQERSIFWLFGQAVTSILASAHVLEIFKTLLGQQQNLNNPPLAPPQEKRQTFC